MRRSLVLTVALLTTGMSGNLCDNTPAEPAQGNYDRVGDLELVVTDPDAALPRGILVVANPEMEQLRFYDTLTRGFVRGPNVYFPVAVRTGPATSRLAQAKGDPTRVYALDSATDTVLTVRTVDESGGDKFSAVGDGFRTGRAPHDIAAVLGDEGILIFVSLPDEGAVQVYLVNPVDGTASERAFIVLGDGAVPAGIAADVIGDVVVVSDGSRSMVSVIDVKQLIVEREIDVGGPSFDVVMGRVDPGDGMAPVALVLRRDSTELAALRLFRPGFREDRVALLGRVVMPEATETAYIPDQAFSTQRTGMTTCCPGLTNEAETTRAWAVVVSSTGTVYYIRFDGTRADGNKGLVRLVDDNPALPGFAGIDGQENPNTAPGVWFPAPGDANRPTISLTAVDNFGSPPLMPLFPLGVALEAEWEGRPVGGRNRVGTFVGGAIAVIPDGVPIANRDVQAGDHVVVDVKDRNTLCPVSGIASYTVATVVSNIITLDALTADDEGCLGIGGNFRFDVHASDAFTVLTTPGNVDGRLRLDPRVDPSDPLPSDAVVQIPALEITIKSASTGPPLRGSKLILELTQNVATLGINLSRDAAVYTRGFGADALVPTALVGSEVAIQGVNEGTARPARRLFLGLGSRRGRILEFNETETSIDSVIGP